MARTATPDACSCGCLVRGQQRLGARRAGLLLHSSQQGEIYLLCSCLRRLSTRLPSGRAAHFMHSTTSESLTCGDPPHRAQSRAAWQTAPQAPPQAGPWPLGLYLGPRQGCCCAPAGSGSAQRLRRSWPGQRAVPRALRGQPSPAPADPQPARQGTKPTHELHCRGEHAAPLCRGRAISLAAAAMPGRACSTSLLQAVCAHHCGSEAQQAAEQQVQPHKTALHLLQCRCERANCCCTGLDAASGTGQQCGGPCHACGRGLGCQYCCSCFIVLVGMQLISAHDLESHLMLAGGLVCCIVVIAASCLTVLAGTRLTWAPCSLKPRMTCPLWGVCTSRCAVCRPPSCRSGTAMSLKTPAPLGTSSPSDPAQHHTHVCANTERQMRQMLWLALWNVNAKPRQHDPDQSAIMTHKSDRPTLWQASVCGRDAAHLNAPAL